MNKYDQEVVQLKDVILFAIELKNPWEEDQNKPVLKVHSSETIILTMEPFELKVLEVLPIGET